MILLSATGTALGHALMSSPTARLRVCLRSGPSTRQRTKKELKLYGTHGKDIAVYFSASEQEKESAGWQLLLLRNQVSDIKT